MTPREQAEVRAREIVIKFFRAEEWERTAVWQKTTQQLIADIRDFAEQAEARELALREALRAIANDHNDGHVPDKRAYDWLQAQARAALLTPTPPQEGKSG